MPHSDVAVLFVTFCQRLPLKALVSFQLPSVTLQRLLLVPHPPWPSPPPFDWQSVVGSKGKQSGFPSSLTNLGSPARDALSYTTVQPPLSASVRDWVNPDQGCIRTAVHRRRRGGNPPPPMDPPPSSPSNVGG